MGGNTMMEFRRASMGVAPMRIDARADADTWTVSGYVTKTGVSYKPVRGWDMSESIAAGAFDTLAEDNTKFLANHEGMPLASVESGTMTVEERDEGVYFVAELQPDDPDAQALRSKVKAGVVTGSSVGMYIRKIEYDREEEHHTITSAELIEVSAVGWPAQPAATIQEGRDQALDRLIRRLAALDAPDPRAPIPEGFDFEELVERVRSTIVETLTSHSLVVASREFVEHLSLDVPPSDPEFDMSAALARLEALNV